MNAATASFVIQAVRPDSLLEESTVLACPEFCNEYEAWVEALSYAERLQAQLLFLLALDRAPWKKDIPARARTFLWSRLQAECALMESLDQELISCLDLFGRAKLPIGLLKGMDISRRFYPERILRPVGEIKLLAPPGSSLDALRVLGKGGYRLVGGSFPDNSQVLLTKQGRTSVIALHARLFQQDSEELMAELWHRSEGNVIAGLPIHAQALHPEDCLVYLIRHCALHTLSSPVWLNDIHFLIEKMKKREMDWDQITWSLAQARSLSAAWLIFSLLRAEWGTEVPADIPARLGKKIGLIRRRMLIKLSRPQAWFPIEKQTLPRLMRSKYLLRDGALNGLKAALSRD